MFADSFLWLQSIYKMIIDGFLFWSFCCLTIFFYYGHFIRPIWRVSNWCIDNNLRSNILQRFHGKKLHFKWTISLNLDFHNAIASVFRTLSYKMCHSPLGLMPSWYRDAFYKTKSERPKHYRIVSVSYLFWQILISYCKFIMQNALKWGSIHICIIVFHQDILKKFEKLLSF